MAGGSGLTGRAVVQYFSELGYLVTAISRRPPLELYGAQFVALDLEDARACREVLGAMRNISRIVFAALYEADRLRDGWFQEEHIRRNAAMLRNVLEPVERASRSLRHVAVVHGPKAYGVHVGGMALSAREGQDERFDIPQFYFAQEEYLRSSQSGKGWCWTILRPGLVVGSAVGSPMNVIAALGVYGALLREDGEPLHYPRSRKYDAIGEACDSDLLARAIGWAGQAEAARNEVFNVTNGDLYSMASMWPVIAGCLGMEVGEDRPMKLAETMPRRAGDWERLRERHGLLAPGMSEFVAQSFQHVDGSSQRSGQVSDTVHVMSTVKIRSAGFHDAVDTRKMFERWFDRYRLQRLLPPL